MFKFYSNVKWACQLVLQNPKSTGNSSLLDDSASHSIEQDDAQQLEEEQYSKELWMHRFYIHVEKVLCAIMRLECCIQEKEIDRKQKVLAEETYAVDRSFREDYDDDQDYFLDEDDTEEMIDLLSNGIMYLLLTEIVLQESPPTIMAYIQQGSANSPDQTQSILLRWLINRDVKPLHPQRQDLITPSELSNAEHFQDDVHESLIEALLYTYINRNLGVEDVVEAIAAMNDGNDADSDYPFDLEDALLSWINQITVIFHTSTGQSGDPPIIEDDLWKGLSDGIAVLKAIAAYRPDALGEDLTFFGSNLSLKDKVFNWQKIIEICDKSMNVLPSFPAIIIAKADDPLFKSNLMAYIVDMFCALVYEVSGDGDRDGDSDVDHESHDDNDDDTASDIDTDDDGVDQSMMRTSTTRLKQSQLIEVQSSLHVPMKQQEEETKKHEKDQMVKITEGDDDGDEDGEEILLEPIKLNPITTERAASASSRRYVQPRESTNNVTLAPPSSIMDLSDSIVEFGGDVSDSILELPMPNKTSLRQSTTLVTLANTQRNENNVAKELPKNPLTTTAATTTETTTPSAPSITVTNPTQLPNSKPISPPSEYSSQVVRRSKINNKSVAIAHLSQVFRNKESLHNVAASISGVIPWRAQSRNDSRGSNVSTRTMTTKTKTTDQHDSTEQMKTLLKQKQKENALLKMKLLEQEQKIEKEREMLRQALEQQRYKIEQEAIRKYIEPNIQAKKERNQRMNILVRSNSSSSSAGGTPTTTPQVSHSSLRIKEQLPPARVTTPRLDSHRPLSARSDNSSMMGDASASVTRLDARSPPESKWKRNGVIQIMPQDQLMNTAAKRKRQQKLEELRRQKIEEENKRKQEMMNQKRQQQQLMQQQQQYATDHNKSTFASSGSSSSAITATPGTPANFTQKNLKTHARTNRLLIKNAISHVCLAGRVNEKEKSEVLGILQEMDAGNEHFVILVRDDKSPVFKALYTTILSATSAENTCTNAHNATSQDSDISGVSAASSTTVSQPSSLKKLAGKGPRILSADMIKAFFRYDSGGKRFIAQPTKTFGVNTDAVVLSEQVARKMMKKKP